MKRRVPLEIASRRQWSSWSDLGHAAIDDQFSRVNEAAVIRGEKHDGLGDFIRFAGAPQRDSGRHLRGVTLDLLVGHATLLVYPGVTTFTEKATLLDHF